MWCKNLIQKVNDKLREYPAIRSKIIILIRNLQYGFAMIKRLIMKKKDGYLTSGRRLTPENENCYFGYYDKSPYSIDGSKIIYHSISSMNAPQVGERAIIYIQKIDTHERKMLGTTLAWNLQQGAMLRFYDKKTVAWNDYRDGNYCTVFHSLDDDSEWCISFPLYDISNNGKYGLTLDFERLNIDAEGYGYIQRGKKSFSSAAIISLVDIKNNKATAIINSKELNEHFPIPQNNIKFFYFNHLCFNPSGKRFLFILRYVYEHKRYSRLFSSDLDGKNIRLLACERMVSHFAWRNDNEFIVFCNHCGKEAYYLLKDMQDTKFEEIQDDYLKRDGHPTFLKNRPSTFISDTYPDLSRRRILFTYDINHHKYKKLAELKSPLKYDGPIRCDLHPRLHPDGEHAVVDSIHEGYRGLYEIEL